MLRLFANIRKNHINTNGWRKYMLYATGEIFLIVISVLLAIQLTGFNENRQEKELAKNYKNLLIADFQKDITQIQKAKEQFSEELNLIKLYEQRLNNLQTNSDTLIHLAKTEFNPNMPPFVRFYTTTFETMKATGDLGLLDNIILNEINELQDLQNEHNYYKEVAFRSHANLLESYLQNYPIHTGLITNGELFEQAWLNVDIGNLSREFNAVLTIKMGLLQNALYYYHRILPKTEQLIYNLQKS